MSMPLKRPSFSLRFASFNFLYLFSAPYDKKRHSMSFNFSFLIQLGFSGLHGIRRFPSMPPGLHRRRLLAATMVAAGLFRRKTDSPLSSLGQAQSPGRAGLVTVMRGRFSAYRSYNRLSAVFKMIWRFLLFEFSHCWLLAFSHSQFEAPNFSPLPRTFNGRSCQMTKCKLPSPQWG